MDALSSAASGLQASSTWLFQSASKIAASGGAPDPQDAVAAYVAAPSPTQRMCASWTSP